MQAELTAEYPTLDITLYGINMPGYESGNESMVDGHTIGLLQDTTIADVTGAWGAIWRDVYVLDQNNEVVEVYNLTTYSLVDQTNYAYLKDLLVTTASSPPAR